MPDSSKARTGASVVALDERRLLPRHRRGDPKAFAELVQLYRAPVFGYLVRCGVAAAVQDDLFQEIFVKVHGAAATYQPDRPLKPWLFTIVANTVRSHYRKLRVQELVFPDGPPDRADPAPGGEELAISRQTAEWMEGAIARLPFAQREVVVLVCIERMALKEAATVLDVPLGTIKTNLHRARLALTRELARRNAQIAREQQGAS